MSALGDMTSVGLGGWWLSSESAPPAPPEATPGEFRWMKQRAIYWERKDALDVNGEPEFEDPVEIPCRWEFDTDVMGLGEAMRFKVLAYVDRDMKAEDYLMLGELGSGTSSDPLMEESWEIQMFNKLPDFKAKKYLRSANCIPSHLTVASLHGRGAEPISYKRVSSQSIAAGGALTQSTSTISISIALRGQPSVMELEMAAGRMVDSDTTWEIPKKLLTGGQPGLEDWIVDGQGVRYDVVGFGESRLLRTWWRISTKRAVS